MTRVVAGRAGGRRITVPRGSRTRPTSERAREGLFSTIESLRGSLGGARMLDLYAGSGAVGIEALSRGASEVCFVESDDVAAGVIRANMTALQMTGGVVWHERVERFVRQVPDGPPYDVAFADPPYAEPADRLATNLSALVDRLAVDALVVVERATRDGDWAWPGGLSAVRERRYGESMLWYGRRS